MSLSPIEDRAIPAAEEAALAFFVARGCLIRRGDVFVHRRDARTVPVAMVETWARRQWAAIPRGALVALALPAAKRALIGIELARTAYARQLEALDRRIGGRR